MYNIKSNGPKIGPCGIPHKVLHCQEKKISFILHTNSDVAFKPFAIEVA